MKSRSYQLQGTPIKLPDLLPMVVGQVTFPLDLLSDSDGFDDYAVRVSSIAGLIADLNLEDEDLDNVEFNGHGYDLISDHPLVISEFALNNDGEVVQEGDFLEGFFIESAVYEVEAHPRRYPKGVDPEELAKSELGLYQVHFDEDTSIGYFKRIAEVQGEEPRAEATGAVKDPWAEMVKADEVDGSDY